MVTKPKIYTEEFVAEKVSEALEIIANDITIIFVGQLAEKTDWFYRQLWSEWRNDFADSARISETIKKVDSIIESRNVAGGINSKLNPTMVIFNLKNNYGWKDQQHIEQNQKNTSRVEVEIMRPNENPSDTSI
jgi:hypothetical protein